MIQIKNVLYRVNPLVAAATLILAALVPILAVERASALQITDRRLMVSSTAANDDVLAPDGTTYTFGNGAGEVPAGDPRNGQKVDHIYEFNPASTTDFEAISFEYCENAFDYVGGGTCTTTADDGLVASGFDARQWNGAATVVVWSDADNDGTVDAGETENWTAASTVANYLTIVSDGSTDLDFDPADRVTVTFTATETNYFVNPGMTGGNYYAVDPAGTYFAHLTTYSDVAMTTPVDDGTVTNSIAQTISIYTRVQETLNFSVEGDEGRDGPSSGFEIAEDDPCTPLDAAQNTLTLGDTNNALAVDQAYFGTSYFRLATNASSGVGVYYSGDTLRSGANTITAIGNAAVASTPGTEQFGFAFDPTDAEANDGSTIVTDNMIGDDANAALTPVAAYDDISGGYAFTEASASTPVLLAENSGVVECDTGSLQYVANIDTDTEAGIYTTKIAFIAAPRY